MSIIYIPSTAAEGGNNNRQRSAAEQLPLSYESLMKMASFENTTLTAPSLNEIYF